MRVLGLALVVAGAAALAGAAAADPIPVPPVPAVTVPVSLPPAPVPLPSIPELPQPVVVAPVQEAPATTSAVTSQLGGAAATVSGVSSTGSASSAPSGNVSQSPSASRVDHFHSSRPWIGTTGSKRRRTTTFTFVLQQAGPVVFTVNQVSPACVGVGRFTVAGREGLNRVRFAGVLHGHALTPGTYRISIRASSGRIVRRVTLVVVDGAAPSLLELRALRLANTCGDDTAGTPSAAGTTGGGVQRLPSPQAAQQPAAAGFAPRGPNLHSGVLGSSVGKTAKAIQPLLVALLAASILLLGLASLPREAVPGPRANDVLARHRIELAALGAVALVGVAVAFLLT